MKAVSLEPDDAVVSGEIVDVSYHASIPWKSAQVRATAIVDDSSDGEQEYVVGSAIMRGDEGQIPEAAEHAQIVYSESGVPVLAWLEVAE